MPPPNSLSYWNCRSGGLQALAQFVKDRRIVVHGDPPRLDDHEVERHVESVCPLPLPAYRYHVLGQGVDGLVLLAALEQGAVALKLEVVGRSDEPDKEFDVQYLIYRDVVLKRKAPGILGTGLQYRCRWSVLLKSPNLKEVRHALEKWAKALHVSPHSRITVTASEPARASLYEVLRKRDVTTDELWVWLFQILFALAAARRQRPSFRHNDLHLGNVLLVQCGTEAEVFRGGSRTWSVAPPEGVSAVLADFGRAYVKGHAREHHGRAFGMGSFDDGFYDVHTLLNAIENTVLETPALQHWWRAPHHWHDARFERLFRGVLMETGLFVPNHRPSATPRRRTYGRFDERAVREQLKEQDVRFLNERARVKREWKERAVKYYGKYRELRNPATWLLETFFGDLESRVPAKTRVNWTGW